MWSIWKVWLPARRYREYKWQVDEEKADILHRRRFRHHPLLPNNPINPPAKRAQHKPNSPVRKQNPLRYNIKSIVIAFPTKSLSLLYS
jgi:hypothetical protein